jgi:hypothetical protein
MEELRELNAAHATADGSCRRGEWARVLRSPLRGRQVRPIRPIRPTKLLQLQLHPNPNLFLSFLFLSSFLFFSVCASLSVTL